MQKFSLKLFSSLVGVLALSSIFFVYAGTETISCTIGNTCATTGDVLTVSAVVGTIPIIDTGGGGYQSGVRFSGYAYPGATVTVQKGPAMAGSVIADASGAFSITIGEDAWQFFSLYATDVFGRKSTILNFPTVLYTGYLTEISGIRFAPTISVDKVSVKQGDYITITGSALPNANLEIVFVEGPEVQTFSLRADNAGVYKITAPLALQKGDYGIKVHYVGDARFSKIIRIAIGDTNTLRVDTTTNIPGDCNFDQRVTIVDFSVLAFWYGKDNPPRCVDTNRDGAINLVDFSILAFYWNT